MRQPSASRRTTQNGLVGLRLPVRVEVGPGACDSGAVVADVVDLADGELRGIAGRRGDVAVQGGRFLSGNRAEHPRGRFVVAGSHGFEKLGDGGGRSVGLGDGFAVSLDAGAAASESRGVVDDWPVPAGLLQPATIKTSAVHKAITCILHMLSTSLSRIAPRS